MKLVKENIGAYAILVILFFWLYRNFSEVFWYGPTFHFEKFSLFFGPFPIVFLLFIISAIAVLFVPFSHIPHNRKSLLLLAFLFLAAIIASIFLRYDTLFVLEIILQIIFSCLIIAVMIKFLPYSYKWAIMSLPFLWALLLPFRVAPGSSFRGSLINVIAYLGEWQDLVFFLLPYSAFILVVLTYFFLKMTKKIKSVRSEIIFAVLTIISYFIMLRFIGSLYYSI